MRPDPDDHSTGSDPARIIYLGEVRRRRHGRSGAPGAQYVAALALVSLLAWAVWLSVVFSLQPARLLSYVAFFLPLCLALAATSAVVLYGVEWRRGLLPSLRRCTARGGLIAVVAVVNLAALASHHWSIFIAGASLLAAAALETLIERRLSQGR